MPQLLDRIHALRVFFQVDYFAFAFYRQQARPFQELLLWSNT
jgi:hypothetical protein